MVGFVFEGIVVSNAILLPFFPLVSLNVQLAVVWISKPSNTFDRDERKIL